MSALLEVYSKEPQMFDEIELLRMYAQLPRTEREALDEAIKGCEIVTLTSLLYAFNMVNTYFKEQ